MNGFEPRATPDAKQENEEPDPYRVSRGLLYSAWSLPLPSGPISHHSDCVMRLSIVLRVFLSLTGPGTAAPFPRNRIALFRSVDPPPSAPSRAPAITALHSRVNSESQPCRLDRMDLPTTSGADPPHFGRSGDVILTVFVVVVGYEEVR